MLMSGLVQINIVKSRSFDGMDKPFVKKENRRPLVTSEYQKRVQQQEQEEDETCDEGCQSMCHMFNPEGDCSHCGCDDQEQNQAQEQNKEDKTCDEGCRSMCHMFSPDGDCSHCGCA